MIWHSPSNDLPCPASFNMADYVLAAGLQHPEKPALEILGGRVWSHCEIRNAVQKAAGFFISRGLKSGDKVLFRLGNRVEFPIAYLGCIWAGLIPVPTSAALTAPEITKIATDLSPDLIFYEPSVALPAIDTTEVTLEAFQSYSGAGVDAAQMGSPDRLAYIIYTSGTSGKPKGVCHAHRAIWARRMMHHDWYDLKPSDRVMHAGAFNWSYTMGTGLMDPWSIGATALIPHDPNQIDALAMALEASQTTIFAASPGIYRKLLKCDLLQKTPDLRHGLSAGEALPRSIRSAWKDKMGTDIHEALGMSECSTFISGAPDTKAPTGTTGKPQPGRRIAVVDQEGAPLPAYDCEGELAIHHTDPGLMIGYLGAAPELPEWFKTGDLVQLSAEGWVTYLGRADDVITTGGFRISPVEIENVFSTFEGIDACAATGVQLKADTTVTALFYSAQKPLDEHGLREHAQKNLAKYKRPHLYIHLPALPKGANGKLNRKLLKQTFRAHHDQT